MHVNVKVYDQSNRERLHVEFPTMPQANEFADALPPRWLNVNGERFRWSRISVRPSQWTGSAALLVDAR